MSGQGLMEVAELKRLINDPDTLLFDCRAQIGDLDYGLRSYKEGHIPGAWHADMDTQLSAPVEPGKTGRHPLPNIDDLSRFLCGCGLRTRSRVVLYDDQNGAMAARLWWLLGYMGFDAVSVLNGGYAAWKADGGEVDTALPSVPSPGDFVPQLRRERLVSSSEVLSSLDSDRYCLLDARSEARFRGEQEPIDPVAGHIPGALFYPFDENLQPDGRFKSAAELRQRFAALASDSRERVCYCGSGVTACHNLLAMRIAGLPEAKLYAGSWSEWIMDTSRPLARG